MAGQALTLASLFGFAHLLFLGLLLTLDKQTKGGIPIPALFPAALELLGEACDILTQAGQAVTQDDYNEAAQAMSVEMARKFANADEAQIQAGVQKMIADAEDSLEDANRSAIRIDSRKWQLKVWNRERFGDVKQIDQTVHVDLTLAMETAQERLDRSRTVDVPVRRIG